MHNDDFVHFRMRDGYPRRWVSEWSPGWVCFFCSFVHSISVCRFYRFYFNWVLQSLQLLLCCCFQRFDCTLRITVLHTVKTTPTKTIKNIEPSKSFFFLLTHSHNRSLSRNIENAWYYQFNVAFSSWNY